MAIEVTFPENGGFTAPHLFGIIDYLTTEAEISTVSTTLVTGTGLFNGSSISFSLSGTGFTTGLIDGDTYVVSGTLNTVTFNSAAHGVVQMNNVNINMATFSPLIASDVSGASPLAIEHFLLQKTWDITLGNLDDIAPKGTVVVDGADFNLTGDDVIRGLGGDDHLFSGDGKDKLFGNLGADKLDGGNGNDIIKGGKGVDQVIGGAGNDKLFGEDGKDILKGGAGKDVLNGGKGRDVSTGGNGADKFVFKNGFGKDKIKDFNATNNKEDIDLKGVSSIKGFKDLKNHHMDGDASGVTSR